MNAAEAIFYSVLVIVVGLYFTVLITGRYPWEKK